VTQKRPEPDGVREPEAAAAHNVIPIRSERERTWRDLVRRLEKSPVPRRPGNR
jgi:hypothetical protein